MKSGSMKKNMIIFLCVLFVCFIVVCVAGFFGKRSHHIRTAGTIEHASQQDAFSSYELIDKRQNGSELNVRIYKAADDSGDIILTQAYRNYGNRWMYHHNVLSEDEVFALHDLVSQEFEANSADESSDVYAKGILSFELDGKSSTYEIAPLDLSAFSIIDPDADPKLTEDKLDLVGDLPDYCDVFEVTMFRSLLEMKEKPQIHAYLDSMYRQIADKIVGSEDSESNLEIAQTMIESVKLESVDEDSFVIVVITMDNERTFTVMKNGYVL